MTDDLFRQDAYLRECSAHITAVTEAGIVLDRTVEQKKKLVEEITRVSVEILGGSPESVDILITDVKRENWATGGKLWLERTS